MSDPMMRVAQMDYLDRVKASPPGREQMARAIADAFENGFSAGNAAQSGRRRVMQIVFQNSGVYSVCSDGSVWMRSEAHPDWVQMPDVPQPGMAANG